MVQSMVTWPQDTSGQNITVGEHAEKANGLMLDRKQKARRGWGTKYNTEKTQPDGLLPSTRPQLLKVPEASRTALPVWQ